MLATDLRNVHATFGSLYLVGDDGHPTRIFLGNFNLVASHRTLHSSVLLLHHVALHFLAVSIAHPPESLCPHTACTIRILLISLPLTSRKKLNTEVSQMIEQNSSAVVPHSYIFAAC